MLSTAAQEVGALLDESIREAGVSRKAVATEMGMDESQLSRYLSGESHQMLDRLLRVDPRVLRVLSTLLALRCGVVVVPDAALEMIATLAGAIGDRRPLRASLPAAAAQRRVG